MAKQIVTKAEGEVYRLEADGSKIKLQTGDLVETGTRIITETGASVRFEDENGIPMELGENSGAVLFSDVLIEQGDTLFAMDTEAAEEPAAEEPQDGEEEQPLPSDSESGSDTVSEMHSFVEMTRTEYGGDINLSYARDVNVTREIEGRASLNPRIEYDYNVSIIQEVKSYEDPRFPFDGGGRGGEESRFEPVRPAADTIPMPETTGTAAVTDEDVPVVIDPLENFVIPSGLQLAVTGASAQYGTVQIIDGKIAYQPNADYHGGDKITVTVTDQAGRTYESEVDVTVSPVVDTVDDSDSVAEHASVDTDVLANDKFADLPGAKVTDVTQGQYGEVTINEDGTVKYTPKTDWLAEGETLTDTYQYTVTTAAGNTETATVTITITGTNEEPLLADDVRYVTEDAPDTNTGLPHGSSFDNDDTSKVTGNILDNDSDPDQNDTLTVTKIEFSDGTTVNVGGTIDGKYGSLKVNGDGTYTYTLNDGTNGDKANNVQQLMADEKATDEFTVSVTDGHTTKTETVTIHITGTNDKPEITKVDGVDSDEHGFTEGDTLSQDGTLTVTDIDVKDTVGTEKMDSLTVGGDYDESSLPGGLTVDDLKNMLTIENGSIDGSSTDGKIDWHFNAGGDDRFDFLADGEKLTLTYKVKSTDGSGAEATHDIKITITGTNDAPKISGDASAAEGGVRETDANHLTVSDTLTVTDVDITNTVTATVKGVSGLTGQQGEPDGDTIKGMFQLADSDEKTFGDSVTIIDDANTGKEGNLIWKFDSGSHNFDYLAVGEEVKLTYTIEVKDSSGSTDTKDIVVTVTGSNDSPVISVDTDKRDSDTISFDDNNYASIADGSAGGTLTLTDVDVSDEVGVTVDGVRIDGSSTYKGDLPTGLEAALENMLSVTTEDILSNTETGKQFSWKFDSGEGHEFDFLAEGETLTLKYTVKADDKNNIAGNTSNPYNETSTGTHEITVTITGTNDEPTLNTTAEVKYDVIEDVTTEATKEANIITGRVTDADAHDILSVTEVNGTNVTTDDTEITGTYGKLVISPDGKYHYLLDNDDNDTQALQKGQSVEDKFIVRVEDGHGGYVDQTITVNVAGRNDSPDIRVVEGKDLAEGGLTEGSLSQLTGTLTLTDADTADKVSAAISGIQVGGTYNLSQLQAAGFLKDPSKLLEMLRIKNTGSPDSDFASRDEIITGTETGSDGNITWKFNAGSEKFAFLNEGETLTLTYTIKADDGQKVETDADGNYISTDTQTVTITITGTNSAPILTNDTNSVTEDNGQLDDSRPEVTTTTGDLFKNDSDPDFNGKANWKITAKESTSENDTEVSADGTDIAGKYGTLHLNPNGTYTYKLNNSFDKIQQLGHDGKLEETFTVTVKDGDLPEQTQNLTITINGTNDAPKITKIVGTDENEAPIYELDIVPSASTPEASGTLTLSDVDLGDKVTVAKLGIDDANFKIEGEQAGLISTRKELYDMLSLSNVDFTTSDGTHSHQFTWTFESGDERFNYLHNNETLILKYRVQATDDSGAGNKTSNDEWITITIKGSNQDGNPAPDTGIVEENDTLTMTETSHSGAINQSNQNLLYNDDSDGHITSFKIGDDGASHNVPATGVNDGWVDVKIGEELIGKIKIEANGNYSFKALNNFSGEVPPITYTNSYGNTGTLQITVTPVADEPTWKEQNDPTKPTPSGDEDTKINLNLKLPEITDNVDLNGNAPGDHPERLGYITLGIPKGATIYNGSSTLTAADGKITVAIVDDAGSLYTDLHYTGLDPNDANVVKLTQAQFEALKVQQAENSGYNIKIDLSVTSYETNDDGEPLKDADGKYISAESSTTVDVDVQAVTDATPDVKILGQDKPGDISNAALKEAVSYDHITLDSGGSTVQNGVTITQDSQTGTSYITMAEDSGTLKLNSDFITAKLTTTDTDGSEHYSITISGLEEGTTVNGVTAGADGTVTLKEGTINSGTDVNNILDGLEITPPENFSGTMTPTVTVTTWDTDGDSSGTIAQNTDTITLPAISVTPVVDGVDTVAVKQAVGDEDTYIDLDIKPSSQDPSETFNVRISDIPDGATIRYGDKDNNIQYKFEKGSWVKTVTGEADQDGMVLEDGKIIINNFDTSKLSILPPKDSNVDFVLKVEAQSVESDGQFPKWEDSPTLDLGVTVHSVADKVSIETTGEHVTYTELQAEEHGIKLSSLIIKTEDAADGSEQVTLTVTGLAPEFTLVGTAVEFKGGAGTERTWLVTMDKNNISNTEAYIKTPNNFSGEIKFSAQATNTDTCTDGISDSNSCTSAITDVTITVTPTPEATVNMSAAAAEDELTKLSFAINHENGDNDETLSTIYIKASDANGGDGKNFEIVYSEDGKTSISLEEALTNGKIGEEEIDGVKYYKITADGRDVDHIYVKGDAEYSGKGGDNSFSFKYEITDEEYISGEIKTKSTPVTEITDGTYNVTFTPVTDATTMVETPVIDDIGGGLTLEGTTVIVNSAQQGADDNNFSVKVTVKAPADTDGSEHLVSLIVDGVPDGVKVDGAVYLGDSEATPGSGRWLVTIDGKTFNEGQSAIEQTINFTVDRGNPNIWALNGQGAQKITITAVSQDRIDGMTGKETESSTKADFDIKINFTGEGPGLTDIPAPGMNITAKGGTVEDAESCALADFFTAKYNYTDDTDYQGQTEFRFSITIKGFPDDATITGDAVVGKGVTISAENGSVTISGFGDDAAIESILKNVKVELPKDYNNNTDGNPNGMKLDVTWKTEGWDLNKNDGSTPTLSGGSDDPIYANVTPVTDPMEITITSENAVIDENQSKETAAGINFTIKVGDGGDGTYGQILYDKLYVKLADGSGEAHGTVKYGEVEYKLTEVKDVEGIADGKYYVIKNVNVGDRIELTYTPDTFYSGNVTVTAQLASQETGAGNIATSEGSLGLTVTPVNTEYNFEVNGAETDENGKAYLTFTPDGAFDKDGSEVVHCAYISGFDAAHGDDFIVKYMLDGEEMTASKVAAGVDGDGKTLYHWVISVDKEGNLPTDVRIEGLNHYSGTQHLTATVVTGETALGTGLMKEVPFTVTFEPTADGFTSFMPTLTFGNSGEYIDLNLNAMVTDTTANNTVETATVTLKGLGDGASFFIEDNGKYTAVTTTYDAGTDTYTISGIALENINDVKIMTPNTGSYKVEVDAWTVVGKKPSDPISKDPTKFGKDFDIKVGEASPTEDGDRLIYNGSGSYDGKGGEDTLFMANFRSDTGKNNIDFSDKSVDIKNIEIIDMSDGDHTLANLTAEAVKDMTDGMNTLLIKGDDGDKIALSSGWTKGADTAEGYHVYTNNGATIKVAGDVNVTISNGIDTASLMMAMAFAPISSEAAVMPDSITDYGDGSIYDGIHGSAPLSIGMEGTLDFSAVSGSMLDSIDMANDTAQSLFNVDPFGVYNITGGSHELTITGTHIDDVSVADASDVPWGAPELSADGSHYTYTATGDFDHNAATPDETVTLNVAREIYDDTLAYDAHALNDGGLGDDTLTFGHEDSVIDFSDGAASQIANIERFDLGDGDHSLANITAKDVFDMTDGRNTLTINGDNADHVSLSDVLNDSSDGMWEASPFHSVENGVGYNVYTGSFEGHTVILKVEEDIIQQLTGISKA